MNKCKGGTENRCKRVLSGVGVSRENHWAPDNRYMVMRTWNKNHKYNPNQKYKLNPITIKYFHKIINWQLVFPCNFPTPN